MKTRVYVHVFFEGQLLISFEDNVSFQQWRRMLPNCWPEVYNRGYALSTAGQEWWRMDLTPVLINDVPKEIRVMALLMQ